MTAAIDYLRLQFEDQAPTIGSGARAVLVVKAGPKWVRLLDPASCVAVQIPRERRLNGKRMEPGFDDLVRGAERLDYNPRRMAARLKRNAKLYDRASATVREAIAELAP